MTKEYMNIADNFIRWGTASDKMRAALVIGSQAREDHPADEYSDMDIVMVVDDPEYFHESDEWLNEIGIFHISFIEDTMNGRKERRVLFDDALDVDFIICPAETINLMPLMPDDDTKRILMHGYSVLIDKIGLTDIIAQMNASMPDDKTEIDKKTKNMLSEAEFINTVNDFWYHTVWAMKKLKRGELWTAKFCVDSYIKWKLMAIIECHARSIRGYDYNTWHNGRFVEEWAEGWIIRRLGACFSRYNPDDIKTALKSTMELFRDVALDVAERLHYRYPKEADDFSAARVLSLI